jgi:hypothetical protein
MVLHNVTAVAAEVDSEKELIRDSKMLGIRKDISGTWFSNFTATPICSAFQC